MIDKIFSFFDEDHQFKEVWQLKLIKFDIDLDQQVKPYQRYLAVSHIVQDTKGNPGLRGNFYVTNLRLLWSGANNRDINLSIGLDTILNISIKPKIVGSGQTKHILIVKTQSPGGNKYQFKFSIFADNEVYVFKKAIQLHKQVNQTKFYRSIDSSLKYNIQTRKLDSILSKQQIFNRYPQGKYYEGDKVYECQFILTNVRVIILMASPTKGISYGIPWIMIQSFDKTTHWEHAVIQMKVRGVLNDKEIHIRSNKNYSKFQSQFTSLCSTYIKNPVLGIDSSNSFTKDFANQLAQPEKRQKDFQQTFETKINIKRTKNAYQNDNNRGDLNDTFFNEELGIMMQKLPPGTTRSELWEILG